MTAINHAVVGGLIAVAIPNPWIAIPLALASHFALDSLPHFGTKKIKDFLKVFSVDCLLVIIFFLVLLLGRPEHWGLIAVCGFVSMSPDFMWAPNAFRTVLGVPRKKLNAFSRFHKNIQWGERDWGLIIEIPTLVVLSYVLILAEK